MNLNKKGYMLVEIIIASVLAMSIAFYLLNLTYKFKDNSEDIYQSYNYMNDKISITKNIMSDLERGTILGDINSIDDYNKGVFFSLKLNEDTSPESRKLLIEKVDNSTIIKYGKLVGDDFDISDVSYYEKKIDSTLVVGAVEISESGVNDPDSLTIKIPIKSIYDDEDYSVKLYAKKLEINKIMKTTFDNNNWVGEKLVGNRNTIEKIEFGSNRCDDTNGGVLINDEKSNSVYACLQDNTIYIDSLNGEKIYFNETQEAFFKGMTALQTIEFNNSIDTSLTTSMREMFNGCSSLTELDLSNFNTVSVTDMSGMFKNCWNLEELDISGWDTSNVIRMGGYEWDYNKESSTYGKRLNIRGMFQGCKALTTGELEEILGIINTIKVENMAFMFEGCTGLSGELNFSSNFNTSNVTDMTYMFSKVGVRDLSDSTLSLNLSSFDTGNVVEMEGMFANSPKLVEINLSNWKTSKVENMHNMFDKCSSLKELDLRSFNTKSLKGMTYMFYQCTNLERIDFGDDFGTDWNTEKLVKLTAVFAGCQSLESLDIGNWNTSGVTDMRGMFYGCYKLGELDLSYWNMAKVTTMKYFTTENVKEDGTKEILYIGGMFQDCHNLKTTITIRNASASIDNYYHMVYEAAIYGDAKIIINYTTETESLVNEIITKKDTVSPTCASDVFFDDNTVPANVEIGRLS